MGDGNSLDNDPNNDIDTICSENSQIYINNMEYVIINSDSSDSLP